MKKRKLSLVILSILIPIIVLMIMQTSNDSAWGGGYWENWLIRHYRLQPHYVHMLVFYFRKTVHFCFYGLLALLLQWYFFLWGLRRKILLPASGVVAVTLIAMSDEYRQSLTSFRTGKIEDVFLDFSGALCLTLVFAWLRHKRRYKAK